MSDKPTYEELRQRVKDLEREVLELKQIKEMPSEQQNCIKTIFSTTLDLFVFKNRDSIYQAVNPAFCRFLGKPEEKIIGKTDVDLFPSAEAEMFRRNDAKVMETGIAKIQTEEVSGEEGKKWLQVSRSPVFDEMGTCIGILCSARAISDHKRTEAALQEIEGKFQVITEQSLMGIGILQGGKFKYVNNAMSEMAGYSSEEIERWAANEFAKLVYPDDRAFLMEQAKKKQVGDEDIRVNYEWRMIARSGKIKWIESYSKPVWYRGNYADFVTMIDITDRKKAEVALQESEIKYSTLVENTNDGVIMISERLLTFVNKASIELVGYAPEELIGADFLNFVAPDYRDLVIDRYADRMEGKDVPSIYEIELLKRDGKTTPVELNAIRIDFGNKPADLVFIRDITERKQAEEALQQSEERYRSLVENTLDGYFICEIPSGRYLFINQRSCDLYGYTMQEGLELTVWDVISPEDHGDIRKRIQARLEGKKLGSERQRYTAVRKDGSTFRAEVSTSLVTFQGRPAVQGVGRDVTEQERLELQLQRAQKMEAVGMLAGGVAHDLNNILSGIVGYPDLLLMQIPESSPLRKPVITMQESGKKAASIVQDLLTLARRGVAAKEILNFNDIISEYLKSPEHEKLESFHPGVEIETHLGLDLLNISGSRVHLSKTIMNLVSNAAEALTDGGKIYISTENRYIDKATSGYDSIDKGGYIILKVADTGIGISSADLGRIFEPFYTKKMMGRSGTGLGMAVVWGTVKDHKGYIDVQSTEGKGTTFTLYFPATRQETAIEEAASSMKDYMGKGESILIVDDVKEQRDVASSMLTALGYTSHTVSSGKEAVEYLKEHTVDLIVLDMIMDPGIDGLETYKKIVEVHPRQKAIIASGFSETYRVKEAQRLGAGKYLKKPYTLEEIGIAVKEELKKIMI